MQATDHIEYFNRYTGKVEVENIYGEGFVRWTYGNPLGKLTLEGVAKRAFFSRWYGRRMNDPASRRKVLSFIEAYGLNVDEFADSSDSFKTFNEFFYRKLKPGARPILPDKDAAVFPADGRHLGFQNIAEAEGIFVKGAKFTLEKLCQDARLAERYKKGSIVLSRLCPVDYHRFHFPVSGTPDRPVLIDGALYSVNPLALKKNINYLTENRRSYTLIKSPEFGEVLMFEVGATCVGSFEYSFTPGVPMHKGDEKGYFKFGGSETITLFEPNRIELARDLLENSKLGRELYARVGDFMGRSTSPFKS
ncbi:MAG TPA: archaetidylserine decarboxylase [Verrucomicrobiae bacterium]|jgi:phosphatidylserine decarboxylase|nr:archaetidylserine decarboxylase [Verrucomicrobiae bacterium]